MLTPKDLRRPLPPSWKFEAAIDTGTYMSCCFILFPPDSLDAFVVEEFPNYRYVGGEIELLNESIPEWTRRVHASFRKYVPGVTRLKAWADSNSQFKTELARYHIHLMSNSRKLELRVEITREYVLSHHLWIAPWLSVLPYEFEHAKWPDGTTSAGRYERVKEHDHTLDTVEHICSRRPRHASMVEPKTKSFLDQHRALNPPVIPGPVDSHLGPN